MPAVRDPGNAQWTVSRLWWPFATWLAQTTESELVFFFALIVTIPLAVIWPFWLLSRLAGMPWTVVVRRMNVVVYREKVSGWTASRKRISDLVEEVRSGGGPGVPGGVTIH